MASAAEAEAASIDAPPEKRLPFDFDQVPLSLEGVALALCELAWLKSRIDTEHAKLEQKIGLLKQDAEHAQKIKVGRNNTTLQERHLQLMEACVEFANKHPEEIERDGKKTRKFTHGEISLRLSNLSIEPLDEKQWDDVLAAIKAAGCPRFVKKKESVDKQLIISELSKAKLDRAKLEELLLKAIEPENKPVVKPSSYTLATPAAL